MSSGSPRPGGLCFASVGRCAQGGQRGRGRPRRRRSSSEAVAATPESLLALRRAGERSSLLGDGRPSTVHTAGSMHRCPSRETTSHPPASRPGTRTGEALQLGAAAETRPAAGGVCADGACREQPLFLTAPRSPFPSYREQRPRSTGP